MFSLGFGPSLVGVTDSLALGLQSFHTCYKHKPWVKHRVIIVLFLSGNDYLLFVSYLSQFYICVVIRIGKSIFCFTGSLKVILNCISSLVKTISVLYEVSVEELFSPCRCKQLQEMIKYSLDQGYL